MPGGFPAWVSVPALYCRSDLKEVPLMFRVGPRTPLPKIAGSHQSMPRAPNSILIPPRPCRGGQRKGGDRTPPLEDVGKQHDEHQRIVFVLVHAGEDRHARLGTRGRLVVLQAKIGRVGGGIGLLFSALPAATVESPLSKHACERSVAVFLRLGRRTRRCRGRRRR